MTRSIDAGVASRYLKKAEGSLKMARIALAEKEYDNAVMSAIHRAINSLDVLTTAYLSKRASGAHTDPDLMSKEDAEKAVKWSERIFVKSVEKLKTR